MTATLPTETPVAVDDFFSKDIPEPFQILGLRLLPLSIGRYRRMARHSVGFVSESQTSADGKDLLLGVLICSMTCRAWDELSTSGKIPKIIASWMRQINVSPPWYIAYDRNKKGKWNAIKHVVSSTFIGRRWRSKHSFDILEKTRLFKTFIDEAQAVPTFLTKGGAGAAGSSHWSLNMEAVLCGELNWTPEHMDEQPLSKAISLYFKHMENQGLITILKDSDFEQVKNNDAAIEKALKDFQAKGGKP